MRIRRNSRALAAPPDTPPGAAWRYGLGFPFQLGPGTAALYANAKVYEGPGQDFEGGVDVVLIEPAGGGTGWRSWVVARNSSATNPRNGGRACILMKYPGQFGFVPHGAKLPDGRPHPHAGTGFSLATCAAWPAGPGETANFTLPDRIGYGPYADERRYRCFELRQLRYDGHELVVGPAERIEADQLVAGYRFISAGMGAAVADGEDLLAGLTGYRGDGHASQVGLVRWRHGGGGWRPADFEAVTPEDDSVEPSLLRDGDGSLLLYARASRTAGPRVRIWRRAPDGGGWSLRMHVPGTIANAALSLDRTPDGTPYVVANLYEAPWPVAAGLHAENGVSRLEPAGRRGERSTLCVWTLNDARDGFDAQYVLRDPWAEFGPPPHGTVWAADHPCGGLVRLSDGRWRSLVAWRLLEWKENSHPIPPGPRTGCYLDELECCGEPVPPWNF